MIKMSGKLKNFVESSENKSMLAQAIGLDETLLSRLVNGQRSASAEVIEKFYLHTAIPLSDSWEVKE